MKASGTDISRWGPPIRITTRRVNLAAKIVESFAYVFTVYDVTDGRPLRVLDQREMAAIQAAFITRAAAGGATSGELLVDVQLTAPLLCISHSADHREALRKALATEIVITGKKYITRPFTVVPMETERRKRSLVFKLPRPEVVSREQLRAMLNQTVSDMKFTDEMVRQLGETNVYMVDFGTVERADAFLAQNRRNGPPGFGYLVIAGFRIPIEKAKPKRTMHQMLQLRGRRKENGAARMTTEKAKKSPTVVFDKSEFPLINKTTGSANTWAAPKEAKPQMDESAQLKELNGRLMQMLKTGRDEMSRMKQEMEQMAAKMARMEAENAEMKTRIQNLMAPATVEKTRAQVQTTASTSEEADDSSVEDVRKRERPSPDQERRKQEAQGAENDSDEGVKPTAKKASPVK